MADNMYEAFATMTIEEAPSMKKVKPERFSTVRVLVILNTLSILLILAHFVLVAVIYNGRYAEMHTSASLHSTTNDHLGPAEIHTSTSTDSTTVSITDVNLEQTTEGPADIHTCPTTDSIKKSLLVCQNNGQVSSDGDCICPARYSGKHCERELTNLARMSGVSCSATSVYSSDYSCDKAIDNNNGTNWVGILQVNPVFLTINFPRSVVITSVKLLPRCALYTQTTRVDYSLSLSSYKIARTCGGTNTIHDCTNVLHDPEVFFKDDVHTKTTSLEVKIHGDFCQKTGYSYLGFREIEIWGYY